MIPISMTALTVRNVIMLCCLIVTLKHRLTSLLQKAPSKNLDSLWRLALNQSVCCICYCLSLLPDVSGTATSFNWQCSLNKAFLFKSGHLSILNFLQMQNTSRAFTWINSRYRCSSGVWCNYTDAKNWQISKERSFIKKQCLSHTTSFSNLYHWFIWIFTDTYHVIFNTFFMYNNRSESLFRSHQTI